MRAFLIAGFLAPAACGSTTTGPATAPTAIRKPRIEPRDPVDVIAALAQPLAESSWIVPGPAQLVLGQGTLQAHEGAPRLEVSVLEEQGSDVRVGVRLEHARFALWMSRAQLLSIVARDQRVMSIGARPASDTMYVMLHRGAQVERLAHKGSTTRVRYLGAFEVDGWLPNDAISDRAEAGTRKTGRIPTGRRPLMLRPGTIVRAEPTWAGPQLAVMSQGYFVDQVKELEDGWSEVSYDDGDLSLRGYVSRRDPPGRLHKRAASDPIAALTTNATARDATCLYSGSEMVGFLVGDRAVMLESTSRPGWYALTIDSPWSAITFDAKGPTETELAKCGE
jgi:hypothetical protein